MTATLTVTYTPGDDALVLNIHASGPTRMRRGQEQSHMVRYRPVGYEMSMLSSNACMQAVLSLPLGGGRPTDKSYWVMWETALRTGHGDHLGLSTGQFHALLVICQGYTRLAEASLAPPLCEALCTAARTLRDRALGVADATVDVLQFARWVHVMVNSVCTNLHERANLVTDVDLPVACPSG